MTKKGVALLRQLNEKRTLALLRQQRISSRHEIAKALDVSKNTASLVVESLIQEGIVREVGINSSKGAGRPSIRISVIPESLKAVGILIQEHNLQYVVTDYYSSLLEEGEVAVEARDAETCLNVLRALCLELVDRHPETLGVGIGAPGLIDPADGIVRYASRVAWQNVNVGQVLSKCLPVPVRVLNQTRAAALAPMALNIVTGNNIVFFIRISEGVGGALIINREIYHGAHSAAGEIGHIPIALSGPVCRCGKSGCIEPILGIPGMTSALRQVLNNSADPFYDLLQQAQESAAGREVLRMAGEYLGQLISYLITLLNPQIIIIDSPYVSADYLKQTALAKAEECSLAYPFQHTGIHFTQLPHCATIGAATAVFLDYEASTGFS